MANIVREDILRFRSLLSDQELQKASEHVYYEAEMLRFSGTTLIHTPPDFGLEYAVFMESFLIHARNLNDFFYIVESAIEKNRKKPPFEDDIIVEDYLGSTQWQKPMENRLSKDDVELVNKRLAHLTYSRPHDGRRYPPKFYARVMMRLMKMVDRFVEATPRSRLDHRLIDGYPWSS